MEQSTARIRGYLWGLAMRRMPGMMTCAALEEAIPDYLDGTLASKLRPRFERHLRLCGACRQYLVAYREAMEVSARVMSQDDEDLPPPSEAFIRAILDGRRPPTSA